jgi:hypothetical protein
LAVVSKLPIKRLKRATREAIEIAGTGQSALAAEQGSFAATIISSPCTAAGASIGRALPEESTGRAESFQRTGGKLPWSSCSEVGIKEAGPFFRDSGQIVRCEASRQFA